MDRIHWAVSAVALGVVVLLVGGSWALTSSALAGPQAPDWQVALNPEGTYASGNLTLQYVNLGNGGGWLPAMTVNAIAEQSASVLPLNSSLAAEGLTVGPGRVQVVATSPASVPSCTPGLAVGNLSYGRYAVVSGADIFGPSVASVEFAADSAWPALGLGVLLPRPYGAQVTNVSTLLTITPLGSGATEARLSYYEYVNESDSTLANRSALFPLNTSQPTVLTVGFDGLGGFVASVNGARVLNGAIPDFFPYPQAFAVWTPSTELVQGVYLAENHQPRYWAESPACGALVLLPVRSTSVPVVAAGAAATVIGPLGAPGPQRIFLVLAFVPEGTLSASIDVTNASPVPCGAGSTLALGFAPRM
jgi:hypothetical protein